MEEWKYGKWKYRNMEKAHIFKIKNVLSSLIRILLAR